MSCPQRILIKIPAGAIRGVDMSKILALLVSTTVLMRSLNLRPSGTLAMGRMLKEANPPRPMALLEAIPLLNGGLVRCVTTLVPQLNLVVMVAMVHLTTLTSLMMMMSLDLMMTLSLTTILRRTLLT